MAEWHLQEAKVRFGELIDDTLEKGPQVVTHRGIDTAVVNSIDERHKLRDENPLTGRMYFWVKVRDSKFHYPNVARSNRANLRCSIVAVPVERSTFIQSLAALSRQFPTHYSLHPLVQGPTVASTFPPGAGESRSTL